MSSLQTVVENLVSQKIVSVEKLPDSIINWYSVSLRMTDSLLAIIEAIIRKNQFMSVKIEIFFVQVLKTLFHTYKHDKKKPTWCDLNPKAVSNDELFGFVVQVSLRVCLYTSSEHRAILRTFQCHTSKSEPVTFWCPRNLRQNLGLVLGFQGVLRNIQ